MMIADIYHPEIWSSFFQLVGIGAAALTGLVFVSMSLKLANKTRSFIVLMLGAALLMKV
jgi:hypothetical protein